MVQLHFERSRQRGGAGKHRPAYILQVRNRLKGRDKSEKAFCIQFCGSNSLVFSSFDDKPSKRTRCKNMHMPKGFTHIHTTLAQCDNSTPCVSPSFTVCPFATGSFLSHPLPSPPPLPVPNRTPPPYLVAQLLLKHLVHLLLLQHQLLLLLLLPPSVPACPILLCPVAHPPLFPLYPIPVLPHQVSILVLVCAHCAVQLQLPLLLPAQGHDKGLPPGRLAQHKATCRAGARKMRPLRGRWSRVEACAGRTLAKN